MVQRMNQAMKAARNARILELRTLGQTLEQIGRDPQVGLSKSNVKKHLDTLLDQLAHEQDDLVKRYKALAYARLEKLLAKAMLLALGGNLKATHQAMLLIQTQARIIGFDAPIKHANTDPDGNMAPVPPGAWTLPMRPTVSIEDWQAQAEAVWMEQKRRDEEALGS
jgi:hypothetical protein